MARRQRTGREDVLRSALNEYRVLERLAKEAGSDQKVQRDLDHLTKELSKGNTEAGLGTKYLEGTENIRYMRGRNGGRLYFREIGGGYVVVAKSSKKNQDQVMGRLQEFYGKK